MWLLYVWIATQIIIEMMPVSSSAHLKLGQWWFKKKYKWDVAEYFSKQNISLSDVYYVLHIPTLCVMVVFLARNYHVIFFDHLSFLHAAFGALIASFVTLCCYYLLKKFCISWPTIFGLAITALVLLYTGACPTDAVIFEPSYSLMVILGLAQGIAVLPGISRLAFTTAAGCCMGLPLFNSFICSWLIMIPLMCAAIGKASLTLYHNGTLGQLLNWRICLAMLVSGVISWYVLKGVLLLIATQKWWLFGWYMAIPIGLWALCACRS